MSERRSVPTLRDVARAAGVSHMTVSRVFSGSAAVRPRTRARVEQIAQELGYTPNGLARELVSRSSRVVGLLASDVTNPYIGELVQAIHRVADAESFVVTTCVTDYEVDRELRSLDVLMQRRVAGLIVTPPNRPVSDDRICALAERGLPVVAAGRQLEHPRVSCIISDTREATYRATNHLIDLGHRRIAYITGSPRVGLGRGKLDGYRSALADHGIAADPGLVVESSQSVRDGYLAMQVLLSRGPRPTAVLGVTDAVAIGAMGAIQSTGLRIPDDLSIIGFDDIPYAASVHPALTTVHQPIEELGRLAARMLFGMIRGQAEPSRAVLRCALVVRATTGPPATPSPRRDRSDPHPPSPRARRLDTVDVGTRLR